MRILYIAPRFHTNQVPIIRGLLRKGNEVKFISHYTGAVENYEDIKPQVLGYSSFFEFVYGIVKRLRILNDAKLNIFRMKGGFPPKALLKKAILEFNPDVVITRERSCYSMSATKICRKNNIPIILYDQSPLWMDKIKDDFLHRLVRRLTPERRMTPVLGRECRKDGTKRVKEPNSAYIPFVMNPHNEIIEEQSNMAGDVNERRQSVKILEIGKYENRKNHIMMLDVFDKLSDQYDIELTIVGECTTKAHTEYYGRLDEIRRNILTRKPWLEEKINLVRNVKAKDMENYYKGADIFVLPSTKEPASISQLEAMSYALPVICSNTNGTSCYVEDGINGFQFEDGNTNDLSDKLEKIIADRALMESFGNSSLKLVNEKYGIEKYIEEVGKLINL